MDRQGSAATRIEPLDPRRFAEISFTPTLYVQIVKPVIDYIGGLVLTIVTLPICLIVAFLVYRDLGNPIILKQQRVGRGGRVFNVYKFRSMEPDRRAGPPDFVGADRRVTHKDANDPRLTDLGRFMRKWSLDELPQLWNVVLGDMSLVGPRPEMVQIVEQYEPWQHQRHVVKPGITGLWQVSARGDLPMHEATDIDIDYVDSISFAKDLEILFKTIPAAMGDGKGH
ncbi:MAG: sugar transferase [Acidimicrobiia bacterium]|nr:sugar transferase [Acidimicrobiia bacterium]NND14170.1 sugar transferase [Acidimicrobiia bacterium]NNL28276.1 sugar transferase [Acidimicrobiia bacterium]NNL47054.1 sugar transferase [Acidimicrobiia bacterium]